MEELTTDPVRERFYKAVRALVTMDDNIRKRVEMAASILMSFGEHDADRLPEEFRDAFNRLRKLHRNDATKEEAKAQAEEIFSFYISLRGGV